MVKWGMPTAGRNKRQVHGEGKEKEKDPRRRSRRKNSRRRQKGWHEDRGESWPPTGVLAEKHVRGLRGGRGERGGNGASWARQREKEARMLSERLVLADCDWGGLCGWWEGCILSAKAWRQGINRGVLCNPPTQPVLEGKCRLGEVQLFTCESSASAWPPWHLCRAHGDMRWACKRNSGWRAGNSKSQFHPQPGKAEQSSARATQVRINLEFSCLESSGWALILGCISGQKQVPQGLRAAQPGLVCALQCSSPFGLGFDWFLQLFWSPRASQGNRSTA